MENPESIAGILFSPDRSSVLLILRRDVPVWVLPGGGIEPGESPEFAVCREILEETGLSVKVDRLVGRYTPVTRLAKRTLLFECSPLTGEFCTNAEVRAIRFFPLSALPSMPPPYPEWIEDARLESEVIERKLSSVNYRAFCKYLLLHPILVIRFLLARAGYALNSK